MAQSNENWMVWNFHQKIIIEEKDITSHVPKFVNVHHVVIKTFQGVRPTKVGNAIMTGIGSHQNPHTP